MQIPMLSFQARKALQVQVGERAGTEIAELLLQLSTRIEQLERSKVNVTRVVPEAPSASERDVTPLRRAA